jgi:hypothetical protein
MFVLSQPSPAVAEAKGDFTLLLASGVSFHDAVLASAERQPNARPLIKAAISAGATRSMTEKAPLVFPGLSTDPATQQAELRQTVQDLTVTTVRTNADPGPGDPLSVGIGGKSIDSDHAWLIDTDTMWIATYLCHGRVFPDDCDLTDKLQGRTTINPGAFASRIDYNILYSPNSGGFLGSHFEWWSRPRSPCRQHHLDGLFWTPSA